uniref:Uncharacterized protein n=1 Tax=Rhinolophus ferrumequinum TaxID=59479 RepID=A0A671E1K0_RHIFE
MHLEDTTRFCPKQQRKSEQTSQQSKPQAGPDLGLLELLLQLFKKKNGNATGEDFCRNGSALWLWWLERRAPNAKVAGSIPTWASELRPLQLRL